MVRIVGFLRPVAQRGRELRLGMVQVASLCPRRGFTIVELMIVLMILAVLAGVGVTKMGDTTTEATVVSTLAHLRTISIAAEAYYNDHGTWPTEVKAGMMPAGLEAYLRPNLFATACPIGGVYDWNQGEHGFAASVSIVDPSPKGSLWIAIDQKVDGLNSGHSEGQLRYQHAGGSPTLSLIVEE